MPLLHAHKRDDTTTMTTAQSAHGLVSFSFPSRKNVGTPQKTKDGRVEMCVFFFLKLIWIKWFVLLWWAGVSRERERGFGGSSFPKVQKEAMMNNEHCGWVSLLKRKKKAEREEGGRFSSWLTCWNVCRRQRFCLIFPESVLSLFWWNYQIFKCISAFRHLGF